MIFQEYLPMLLAILGFLAICLLFIGIYYFVTEMMNKRKIVSKIRQAGSQHINLEDKSKEAKKKESVFQKVLGQLSQFGSKVTPKKSVDYSAMRLKFLRAGIRNPNALFLLYGSKFILAFLFPICYLLLKMVLAFIVPSAWNMFFCILLAFIGYYLPDIWLKVKGEKRQEKILKSFPDALDLLVVCVEAGIGLDAAIYRVAEEMRLSSKDISDEFKLVNFELRSGKSRQEALNNLALRTDLEEVKNFVGLLNQTFQFGTSVSNALRVYSDTFRTNRRQKAEEVAAKLPTKLMLTCVFFIFPAIFVVMVGPAAIQIYNVLIK